MFPHRWIALPMLCIGALACAQSPAPPPTFRLVLPHGPGSILINTTDGWKLDHVLLYDKGSRPVVQLNNQQLGLVVSYILDDEPQYNDTSEMCRNDALGTIVNGPLAKATLKNKQAGSRTLGSGQTMAMGSYLIVKNEGATLNQENVFGFIAKHHLCGEIHISRTPFQPGEESLFDPLLNAFTYDPDYIPTPGDYATMARLLPPGMAVAFRSQTQLSASAVPEPASPSQPAQSLSLALPNHPGYLSMDAPGFAITELSAKPNGYEFGIRGHDARFSQGEVLAFLFLPNPPQPTAVACRDWMLTEEQNDRLAPRKILEKTEMKSESGIPIALVDYEQGKPASPFHFVRRAFVAQGDLCADIALTAPNKIIADAEQVLLRSLIFDPARAPDFFATFRYATVLYDHHQFAAAAPIFESALRLVASVPDPDHWRRITTDQASMAYGISGNLQRSREINEAAIAKDPEYPLFYYNLACADAEVGNANAAQKHLQQAFDRRANVLKGEKLPDPSKDDSILKLKHDKQFWAFVQSLPIA